jgi:glycosyltransferase involved in cell wall biosynthesis
MSKKTKSKAKSPTHWPFVSICTPTFNRRPFIPIIIQCVENQTYPKDRIEWIIVDDGTDKIKDLVAHLPYVKYFQYDEKMTLGKKRNLTNEKATGDILVYMDDDDYYPPDRVKHAVERLRGSKCLCAGSSAMYIYFKHIDKMYQFGPYGPNHATAATFAFKRELLAQTRFEEGSCVAEEKKFLKEYTIPFVQLDTDKSIVVFSHNHNSFDKKELLKQLPNPCIHETTLTPRDLVKEPDVLRFFMEDINELLEQYEPGRLDYKPDVKLQLEQMKASREKMIQEEMQKMSQYQDAMNKITMHNFPKEAQEKITQQNILLHQLTIENNQLKEKVDYLTNKMKQLIADSIEQRKKV